MEFGAILAFDKICRTDPNWVLYLLSTHWGIICLEKNLRSSQLASNTTLYLKRTSSASLKRFVESMSSDGGSYFLASNTCEFCRWTVLQLGLGDGFRVKKVGEVEDD